MELPQICAVGLTGRPGGAHDSLSWSWSSAANARVDLDPYPISPANKNIYSLSAILDGFIVTTKKPLFKFICYV
jgi:hypothetical protein